MKIFFVDIDGTIVESDKGILEPTIRTKYAFQKIRENGDLVFICSGRAKCLLPHDILNLAANGYVLANGAYVEYENKVIYSKNMNSEALIALIDYCNNHDYLYYLEDYDVIYTQSLKHPLHLEFCKGWGVDCYSDDAISDDARINIAMLAMKNPSEKEYNDLEKFLDQYFDYSRHVFFTSYDLNIRGINKGYAIKQLLNYFNISICDAYAFGDGNNDIEMMQAVKHSVAMANASDNLKAVSKEFTSSVSDDGFYEYLVKKSIINPLV